MSSGRCKTRRSTDCGASALLTSWPGECLRGTRLHPGHRARGPDRRPHDVAGRGRRRGDRADRAAQPEPDRLRLHRLRRGAGERAGGGARRGRRRGARPAARRAGGDQGPVRLQAGLEVVLRRRACAARLRGRRSLPVRGAHRGGRRDHPRQDEQPRDGLPRHHRQLPVRPLAQPVRHHPQHGRIVGRLGGCRRGRPGAAGRGHRRRRLDPHPRLVVRRLWHEAVVRARAVRRPPERVRLDQPVPGGGADHPHRRRRRAGADRAERLRLPRPVRAGRQGRLPGQLDPVDRGHAHRLLARPRRLPGRPGRGRDGAARGRRLRGGRRDRRGGLDGHRALAHRAGRAVVPDDHPGQLRGPAVVHRRRHRPAGRAP